MPCALAAAVAWGLAGCSGEPEESRTTELEGVWHVETADRNGHPTPVWDEANWTFAGDGLTSSDSVVETEGSTVVDSTASPKTIDITLQLGKESWPLRGIYELDGDSLRICASPDDKERPAEFKSTEDGGELLFVLKRGPSTNQETTYRAQQNRLKNIGTAMHSFAAEKRRFPGQAIYDAQGEPLLSWRVAILPYLDGGQSALYEQFHLDEPWDSEHNKALIDKMPDAYKSAGVDGPGETAMMVFTGRGTPFEGKGGPDLSDFGSDGTSHVFLVVQAGPDKTVPWTKPEDLTLDEENPMAAMGTISRGAFLALYADGSVGQVPTFIFPEHLLSLIRIRDGGLRPR